MIEKFSGLGTLLKSAREAKGMSQKQISEKLGYTPQFVSNWERGVSLPPMNVLKELGSIYEINGDDLFNALLETKVNEVRVSLTRAFSKRA